MIITKTNFNAKCLTFNGDWGELEDSGALEKIVQDDDENYRSDNDFQGQLQYSKIKK